MARRKKANTTDRNEDPITGEPGSHPVGTGVGTAVGGAAAGIAAGAAAGPVGAVAGAVVGGVAGGLAGHAVGEWIDPTAEEAYWRENFKSRPYVAEDSTFDRYAPAYRFGLNSSERYPGKTFSEVERDVSSGWTSARGASDLDWNRARPAVRDAYDRTNKLREEHLKTCGSRSGTDVKVDSKDVTKR
jgi:hypothetical protein